MQKRINGHYYTEFQWKVLWAFIHSLHYSFVHLLNNSWIDTECWQQGTRPGAGYTSFRVQSTGSRVWPSYSLQRGGHQAFKPSTERNCKSWVPLLIGIPVVSDLSTSHVSVIILSRGTSSSVDNSTSASLTGIAMLLKVFIHMKLYIYIIILLNFLY